MKSNAIQFNWTTRCRKRFVRISYSFLFYRYRIPIRIYKVEIDLNWYSEPLRRDRKQLAGSIPCIASRVLHSHPRGFRERSDPLHGSYPRPSWTRRPIVIAHTPPLTAQFCTMRRRSLEAVPQIAAAPRSAATAVDAVSRGDDIHPTTTLQARAHGSKFEFDSSKLWKLWIANGSSGTSTLWIDWKRFQWAGARRIRQFAFVNVFPVDGPNVPLISAVIRAWT